MCTQAIPVFDISLPEPPLDFFKSLALFYSMVPLLVSGVLIILIFWTKRLSCFLGFVLQFMIMLTNELLLKVPLFSFSFQFFAKPVLQQERPEVSCVRSFGMPSSHAAVTLGLFSWIAFELYSRPVSDDRRTLLVFLSGIVALPVPISRVWLGDHSLLQVLVGSFEGIIIGYFFHLFLTSFNFKILESIPLLKFLRNDYERRVEKERYIDV